MTEEELRSSLRAILSIEDRLQIDWQAVERLCDQTIRRLVTEEPAPEYPHDVVFHFLDDPDVRRKDAYYAEVQRQRLKAWLGKN
jgi:hypothetical protein